MHNSSTKLDQTNLILVVGGGIDVVLVAQSHAKTIVVLLHKLLHRRWICR